MLSVGACSLVLRQLVALVAFHPAGAADPYGDEPANNFFYYSCQKLEQWVKLFRLGIDFGLG